MTPKEHAKIILDGMLSRQIRGWAHRERAQECALLLVREVKDAIEQGREPSEVQWNYWDEIETIITNNDL